MSGSWRAESQSLPKNRVQARLVFVTEAMRKLLADDNFVTLLRAEALETLPKNLAMRIDVRGAA
jgi:ParB family transcriptional regulator, chromosome partitioning protein